MIKFLETDPKTIFSSLKNRFESISNRVLYPAQVENLLLRVAAYSASNRPFIRTKNMPNWLNNDPNAVWQDKIPLIQVDDPVLGGVGGPVNVLH